MTNRSSEILTRAEARLGSVLRGKYRLDRVLGVGGMAVVYKATHRNQAEFAVKMLHSELSLSADIRSRFLREGYAANSVKHPGAVLVVDDDVAEDGSAFLVMELLDGVGCDELWERGGQRVSPHVASAIVIQLLDVLAAAHAKETVHRDIKPANLFLTRNGTVKVLDFGIARAREALNAGAHATGTGALMGTPAFMPPEQARGKTREIDARTDLWAAGATFFTLVSGQIVHAAESAHEAFIAAAMEPARPLASVVRGLPSALVAVIDRSLAFRREDRWQSATEMRTALLEATRASFGTASPDAVVAAALPQGGGFAALVPSVPSPPLARTIPSEPGTGSSAKDAPAQSFPRVLTTASASSSDRAPQRSAPTPPRWVIPAGVAIVASLAVGGWAARRSVQRPDRPGVAEALAAPAIHQELARDAGAAHAVVEPEIATGPAATVAPAAEANDVAVRVSEAGAAKETRPRPPPPAPPPARPPAAVSPPPPKVSCNPPYYIDAKGAQVFKKECL